MFSVIFKMQARGLAGLRILLVSIENVFDVRRHTLLALVVLGKYELECDDAEIRIVQSAELHGRLVAGMPAAHDLKRLLLYLVGMGSARVRGLLRRELRWLVDHLGAERRLRVLDNCNGVVAGLLGFAG